MAQNVYALLGFPQSHWIKDLSKTRWNALERTKDPSTYISGRQVTHASIHLNGTVLRGVGLPALTNGWSVGSSCDDGGVLLRFGIG